MGEVVGGRVGQCAVVDPHTLITATLPASEKDSHLSEGSRGVTLGNGVG